MAFTDPVCPENSLPDTLAFDEPQAATGFGRYTFTDAPPLNEITTYIVSTTADYMPDVESPISGSLRYVINEIGTDSGIIEFHTTGEINLKDQLVLRGGFVWMDGRTSAPYYDEEAFPEGGITVTGHQFALVDCHDVVIRYMRFRSGVHPAGGFHCYRSLAIDGATSTVNHVIIDHCSIGASQDDNLSIWDRVCHLTVQYCIIGGGVYNAAKAGIGSGGPYSRQTSAGITICHNLITNTGLRQLAFAGRERIDFYNNVVGNSIWSTEFSSEDPEHGPRINILYNYYRTGTFPGSTSSPYLYDPIRAHPTDEPCNAPCPYLYIGTNHESISVEGNEYWRFIVGSNPPTWEQPYNDQWDLTLSARDNGPLTENLPTVLQRPSPWSMWESDDVVTDMGQLFDDMVMDAGGENAIRVGCWDPSSDIYLDSGSDQCDQELLDAVRPGQKLFPDTDDYDLHSGVGP